MKIAIASDHAGYQLKEKIVKELNNTATSFLDLGAFSTESSDYPDYALKVGEAILSGKADRGILICGSGIGICIAANKIKGIYAGICHDTYSAHQGVEHDDMNVLCLGAQVVGVDLAIEIVTTFLSARYIGNDEGQERHARRVAKIKSLETGKIE
jgi:ribose 5-phosphate isomerase B